MGIVILHNGPRPIKRYRGAQHKLSSYSNARRGRGDVEGHCANFGPLSKRQSADLKNIYFEKSLLRFKARFENESELL